MKKRVVMCLAAGSLLTVAGCGPAAADPETIPEVARDPDAIPEIHRNPPPISRWEDVKSGHPEGATNPPSPVLLVNPHTGQCFKKWVDPRRLEPDAVREDCPGPDGQCGRATLCPEDGRAEKLIAQWRAPATRLGPTRNPPQPPRPKQPE